MNNIYFLRYCHHSYILRFLLSVWRLSLLGLVFSEKRASIGCVFFPKSVTPGYLDTFWRLYWWCLGVYTRPKQWQRGYHFIRRSLLPVLDPYSSHFQRVAEWGLHGVWRMSGGCLEVYSGRLWVSSQSFGHNDAWSSPKIWSVVLHLSACLFPSQL